MYGLFSSERKDKALTESNQLPGLGPEAKGKKKKTIKFTGAYSNGRPDRYDKYYINMVEKSRGVRLDSRHEVGLREVKAFLLKHLIPFDQLTRELDSFYFTTRSVIHATVVDP